MLKTSFSFRPREVANRYNGLGVPLAGRNDKRIKVTKIQELNYPYAFITMKRTIMRINQRARQNPFWHQRQWSTLTPKFTERLLKIIKWSRWKFLVTEQEAKEFTYGRLQAGTKNVSMKRVERHYTTRNDHQNFLFLKKWLWFTFEGKENRFFGRILCLRT